MAVTVPKTTVRKQSLTGKTDRQIRFIQILSEQLKNPPKDPKDRKTLGQICLEAGYSKSVSKLPWIILRSEAVNSAIQPILDRLEQKRDLALKYLTEEKLEQASARDATYITVELTKIGQLLGGKPTENVKTISDEEQIAAIAARVRSHGEPASEEIPDRFLHSDEPQL